VSGRHWNGIALRAKVGFDLIGQVVGVDDRFAAAGPRQGHDNPVEERATGDGKEGFGDVTGMR